jgi:hypothetical protein
MLKHLQAERERERERDLLILVQGEKTICMDKVISSWICGEGFTPERKLIINKLNIEI